MKTTDAAEAIQQWADREGILFRRFGFDFEIPIQLMRAFFSKDRRALVSELWRYLKAFGERKWANGYFRKYIETLHADEVETEFYVFPRILRVLLGGGMTPLPGWRMVEMLYTSAMSRKLGGWITRHRDRSAIPALGIVSGVEGMTPGMDLGGGDLPHHLTTEELAGDISALWAAPSLNEVYLFALNGSKVLELLGNAIDRTIRCQLRA